MEINFDFVNSLKEVVLRAYEESKKIEDLGIENKELNDIVTKVDLFMEKKIVEKLQEWFPEHSIYSEEIGELSKKSEYEWLIDPIDGTINFSSEIPMFATSIALRKNQDTIFGFIYDYTHEKCYYAIKGQGAYCNGERIHVSEKKELSDCVLSFCLTSHYNTEKINEILEVEKMLASKVRGLRLIVSAAIELAWCAEGKIDGCINVKPSVGLSSASGKLLVSEAGGMVTNCKGQKRKNIDTMLVTNGKIHDKVVNEIKDVIVTKSKHKEMNIQNTSKATIEYEKLHEEVKAKLSEKRFKHSEGVVKRAIEYAQIYGVNENTVKLCAIAHDIAKELTQEEIDKYAKKYNIIFDEIEKINKDLIHAKVGAYICMNEYNFSEEMFNAVRYHTTGKANMSTLEKIIYLADSTEENRKYDSTYYVEIIKKDIDSGIIEMCKYVINKLVEKNKIIHPDSIECYNYYVKCKAK